MTAPSIRGRGAVITGAGRGIGAAVASTLGEAGARMVLVARSEKEIEAMAAALRARGVEAWAHRCDVTDEAAVAALTEEARSRLGAVEILINNAGDSASAPLPRVSLAEWNRMLAVNATGTFLCTRAFAPGMVERGWGRIVNMASKAGLEGAKYIAHYSAAKHAVVGFTRSVACELAGTGVTVNAVCPGYVDTPMTARNLENVQQRTGLAPGRALAAVLAASGQDRLAKPEEVAEVVLALCLDAGGTQGETLLVPWMRP